VRWLNGVFVLLVNAVPLYGVKVLGWSIGTVLILYWLENLLVALFTCARIALHRALTRKAGHFRGGRAASGLLADYAPVALVFTLVHGIFVVAIVFIVGANRPDMAGWPFSYEQFRYGALQMLAVLALDFLVDALTMRARPFAWIKAYAGQRLGRVLILHLGIIFGMWAMFATDSPLGVLYVIIGLKTLWELAAGNAAATAAPLPARPPAWALKMADRIARDKGGAQKMIEDWQRSAESERRQAVEDEAVVAR